MLNEHETALLGAIYQASVEGLPAIPFDETRLPRDPVQAVAAILAVTEGKAATIRQRVTPVPWFLLGPVAALKPKREAAARDALLAGGFIQKHERQAATDRCAFCLPHGLLIWYTHHANGLPVPYLGTIGHDPVPILALGPQAGFTVTVRGFDFARGHSGVDAILARLNDTQRDAYAIVQADPGIDGKTLARRLGVTDAHVRKSVLPVLKRERLIANRGKSGYFAVR